MLVSTLLLAGVAGALITIPHANISVSPSQSPEGQRTLSPRPPYWDPTKHEYLIFRTILNFHIRLYLLNVIVL